MVSIIITSYKEPKTIGKLIDTLVDKSYSGMQGDFELITVIPDKETNLAAEKAIKKYPKIKWQQIVDPKKGKPHALNLAFEKAKGKELVLTDGDIFFDKKAVGKLLAKLENEKIGGVTGRPVSIDTKNKFMGYIGHLLADAAHHKRTVTMTQHKSGKALKLISKEPFFVMSGYIMAIKNLGYKLPEDCLIDDAYISYHIFNEGLRVAYEPKAIAYISYAQTVSDWYKQKLRSVGGYVQLWKYGIIKNNTKVRNFWKELEYFWFPIKYSSSIKELFWSLLLYPMRLWLWLKIFWQQRVRNKSLDEVWVRIESTK